MADVQLVVMCVSAVAVMVALTACIVLLSRRVASTNKDISDLAKQMAEHALAHDADQREMKRIQLETDREAILLREKMNAGRRVPKDVPDNGYAQPDYQATVDIMDN